MAKVMTTQLTDANGRTRTVTETRTGYAVTDEHGQVIETGASSDGRTGGHDAIKAQERRGFRQRI